MRTILFGNHKKYNSLLRAAFYVAAGLMLLVSSAATTAFGQIDWSVPIKRCWVFPNPDASRTSLASDNDHLFIPTSKGTIIALLQKTGAIAWEADLGGNLETRLFVRNGELFASAVFGNSTSESSNSVIRMIDPKTGIPRWSYRDINAIRSFHNGGPASEVVLSSTEGTIIGLSPFGKVVWKRGFDTSITTEIAEFGSKLAFGTANKTLIVVNSGENGRISQVNMRMIPEALAVSENGAFFAGDTGGNVYALDPESMRVSWTTKTGAGISKIGFFEDDLIVSSKDNFVYRISSYSGKKLWKRKLAGRILGDVNIDASHAVFLTSGASTALLLDLRNGNLINKFDFGEAFVSGPVPIRNGFAVPTVSTVTAVSVGNCLK